MGVELKGPRYGVARLPAVNVSVTASVAGGADTTARTAPTAASGAPAAPRNPEPCSPSLKRPPQKQIKRMLPLIIKPRSHINRPQKRVHPQKHAGVMP